MTRTVLSLAALLAAAAADAQVAGPYVPRPPPPTQPAPVAPSAPAPAAPPPAAPSAAAPAAPAAGAAPTAAKPTLPRGAVLEEVAGTVVDVDRKEHKLAVETTVGTVTLALDRNTMVYTGGGLGTVLDVKLGSQIRAGRNADYLAYWVQVRGAQAAATPSTPGQGTGPAGGGSAPSGESVGPGAGPAPAAPTGTGPAGTPAPGAGPPAP